MKQPRPMLIHCYIICDNVFYFKIRSLGLYNECHSDVLYIPVMYHMQYIIFRLYVNPKYKRLLYTHCSSRKRLMAPVLLLCLRRQSATIPTCHSFAVVVVRVEFTVQQRSAFRETVPVINVIALENGVSYDTSFIEGTSRKSLKFVRVYMIEGETF